MAPPNQAEESNYNGVRMEMRQPEAKEQTILQPASKTQVMMQVRTSQVDQKELLRLLQVEAMELPDLGVVISGMAGRFPKCNSVNDFEENLRLGRDMTSDRDDFRWPYGLWTLPPRAGRLNDLSLFDYEFFGFTLDRANHVDFQLRILYEVVYESILDAGLNPANLRGSNTSVLFGFHSPEFENEIANDFNSKTGGYYGQLAVKVAQYFDFRGLTLTYDAACASGLVGLHNAVQAVRDGLCDQAIVCSVNIPVDPKSSYLFRQMQMLSPTGYLRFMDSRADGYVKGEACVSMVLQREQVAKRCYASFMATMTNVDGHKPEGITFPSVKSQESLIRATKELADISTNHVEYLEAHGTGTPAGDPQEACAISNVYYAKELDGKVSNEQRLIGPLLVGSVKTTIGHTEGASGLCSLVKVALMLEHETIYKSLHFEQPNANIDSLMDGRLKFTGEPLPLRSRIIPLSCYGFGGTNVHVICRANRREQIPKLCLESSEHQITTGGLPRLVLMFGRGQQEVESFFKQLLDTDTYQTRNCLTDDFISLIDSLSSNKIDRLMNYRGFCLLDARQRRQLFTSVKRCDLGVSLEEVHDLGRKVHHQETLVRRCHMTFPGLGCQWEGMGAGLVGLRPFWSTIERAAEHLKTFKSSESLDLIRFLTRQQDDKSFGKTTMNEPNLSLTFVSIVAYQLALVNLIRDTLRVRQLGSPVGHSLGEIACAYAGELLDERQALMMAHELGKTLEELGPLVSGKMLTIVGPDRQQVVNMLELHQDLYESLRVSCFNGPNSVTISGRAQEVDEFMLIEMEQWRQSMTVSEVSSQVALHNEFIMDRHEIQTALRQVLERVMMTDRNGDSAQIKCAINANYFIEMLCRPVDILAALDQLEPDSIIYELSPSNSLESHIVQLQCEAPLASGEKAKFHYVKSMEKSLDPTKQVQNLLNSFGQLYQLGATFELANLYSQQTGKQVTLPVRRQTPSISSLVGWQHSTKLFVPRYPDHFGRSSAKYELIVDFLEDEDKYLTGHCIDGRVLFPATGYLLLMWRVFSMTKSEIFSRPFKDLEHQLLPVEFHNVRLLRAVILGQHPTQLVFQFNEATGKFEIKEGGSLVAEGYAKSPQVKPEGLLYEDVRLRLNNERLTRQKLEGETIELNKEDVYKQLRVHGYDYGDTFQCIESSSFGSLVSRIKFNGHFVSLTDSMLQSMILSVLRHAPSDGLFLPTRFDYVRFHPEAIFKRLQDAGFSFEASSSNQRDQRVNWNKSRENSSEPIERTDQTKVGTEDEERKLDQLEEQQNELECFFETFYDAQTRIMITDGIEMRGVKASPAPRRLDNNEPILESYQFVSDFELPVEDECLTKFEAVIRPYARACDWMSQALLKCVLGLKCDSSQSYSERQLQAYKKRHLECLYDSNDDLTNKDKSIVKTQEKMQQVSSYDIKRNGKRTLISVLDQLVKLNESKVMHREKLSELIQLNHNHLTRDLLQATFTCERFLRPLIETVIENVCQRKSQVSLLEINPDDGVMGTTFPNLMQQIDPNLALDYSLAHPNPNRLHGAATGPGDSNNKTFTLKPDNLEGLFDDYQLSGLDLIVFKDQSCYRADEQQQQDLKVKLSQTLVTLSRALAPAGYCLLLMRRQMTHAERVVLALEDQTIGFGELEREVDQMNERLAKRCNKLLEIVGSEEEQRLFKLHLVAKKSDQNGCLMLLFRQICAANNLQEQQQQQQVAEIERTFLRVRHDKLDWLDELKEIFKTNGTNSSEQTDEQEPIGEQKQPKQVWLCAVATRQNPISGLIGMVQALRKELGSNNLRCFYDQFTFARTDESNVTLGQIRESNLFQEALKRDHIWNCVDSNGQLGSFRHLTISNFLSLDEFLCANQLDRADCEEVQDGDNHLPTNAFINNLIRGDLSSFAWFEAPLKFLSEQQQSEQLVRVAYSALNFRDIMLATGRLPLDALPPRLAMSDCQLGLEFSGFDGRGRRVMGMVDGRGIATHVLAPPESSLIIELPDWLSLREAATIPAVYATATMALIYRGRMRQGESILIHAGSGGVGQAAIRLALHFGLEVFTTVGSLEKREFLLDQFSASGLQQDHIFDSRSCQFETDILSATRGRGVDLILNSLADDKLQASLNCLAEGGRFLEIGKYDMSMDTRLELLKLDVNKSFHGILVDKLFDLDELNDSFKSQLKLVLDTLKQGLREGFIKPIQFKLFKSQQVEEAFRFMATGKHIGKVLIEIDARLDQEECDRISLNPLQLRAVPRFQLSPHDSFIVTGGLGGFGLELCKWLALRGARRLVLTSRHGLRTGYQRATLGGLEQVFGVKILIINEHEADASQLEGAKRLLQIGREFADASQRVGGIFHLAMVLRDALLENMTREDFELVLRPKVLTCLALDGALQEMGLGLDYFVTFSSVASGKGNAGQANYAYANSCLERLCEQRRSRGQHALAIQWGAIGDVGVAFENLGGNEVIIGGTIPQRLPSCLATLGKLLATPFSTCLSVVPATRRQNALAERGDLVGAIMHVLGIKDHSKVSADATLADLGLDSLMAVEIRQYIEREHEITLTVQEIRALTIERIREIGERSKSNGGGTQSERKTRIGEAPKRQVASYGKQPNGEKEENSNKAVPLSQNSAEISLNGQSAATNLEQASLARLERNMAASFVPALELPDEDFCLLNPKSNQQKKPIFFLGPIDGRFDQLRSVCAHIERPCVGLNWTRKLGQTQTVDEVVEIYVNLLEQFNLCPISKPTQSNKFEVPPNGGIKIDLVGHSFGATIAFELMAAIEKRDHFLKNQLERRLSNGSQRPQMMQIAATANGTGRSLLTAGRLVLLNGSPKQIELGSQYSTGPNLPSKLEDKFDELLMVFVMANEHSALKGPDSTATETDYSELMNELKSRNNFKAKVALASERLAEILDKKEGNLADGKFRIFSEKQSQERRQSIYHAMEAFLRRYELIDCYQARRRLSGDCTLIRAKKLFIGNEQKMEFSDDLDLTSLVAGQVELFIMQGDDESFLVENEREIGQIIESASENGLTRDGSARTGRPIERKRQLASAQSRDSREAPAR